jgi:hypothetical protein
MITAEEARKRVDTKYEQEVRTEIDEIDRKILDAVDKGDTSIFIFHNIHTETANYLRDLGYTVEQDNFRNEVDITISW